MPLTVEFLLLPLTILFLVASLYFTKKAKSKVSSKFPVGYSGLPFVGETFAFLEPHLATARGKFMEHRISRFGRIFSSNLFGNQTVISADADLNRFVLKNDMRLFGLGWPSAFNKVIGEGSISLTVGDAHKHIRSTILQFLSNERIRSVFLRDVDHIASLLMSSWNEGSVFSATDEAKKEEHLHVLRTKTHKGDCKFTWDDYRSLEFTKCVINETLRLSSISSGVPRKATEDVEFKGYEIPRGCIVWLHYKSVHLDPLLYEDPEHFNPWRWLSLSSTHITNNFMPFGGGVRLCPGSELARLEMAVFLHHLILKYDRELAEPDHPINSSFMDFPKGLPIKVQAKKLTK